jgi:hypothetical protein
MGVSDQHGGFPDWLMFELWSSEMSNLRAKSAAINPVDHVLFQMLRKPLWREQKKNRNEE